MYVIENSLGILIFVIDMIKKFAKSIQGKSMQYAVILLYEVIMCGIFILLYISYIYRRWYKNDLRFRKGNLQD